MYPTRYYPDRFYAPRYWPRAGATAPPPTRILALVCRFEATLSLAAVGDATVSLSCTGEPTMRLACSFDNLLTLTMGGDAMPPEQQLRLIRAQDLALRFTMDRPRSIASWSVTFQVKTKLGGTSVLTKTVGSGVALTDTGRGILTVSLAKADTSSLTVTSVLASGEGYIWDLKRTDSGNALVLARGELVLEQEVTS